VPDFKSGAIPNWLKVSWLCFAPVGLLFSSRIAWEKTFLRWQQGPQMVGFSLGHILPAFFIVGILCCYSLILWLAPASIYVIVRRKRISTVDIAMILAGVFAAVVMVLPDTFFATTR
jgi:hypothetical protein